MSSDTSTSTVPALLEASIEIEAPPAKVWSLVTDVARMASWSPQVVRTVVLGRPLRKGTRFLNLNRRGPAFWPTSAQVVRFQPHREFAFRVVENWTIWSFSLEGTETGGTRVVQRRETPRGVSPISSVLTKIALGGHEPFAAELLEGMNETLARVKAEAERR